MSRPRAARPPLTRLSGRARRALVAGLLLGLPACTGAAAPPAAPAPATGPVTVPVPSAGPAARTACARLISALPDTLGPGLARRPVADAPDRAAAWGDPPLVLRCGTAPAGRPGVDGEPVSLGPPDGRVLSFLVDDVGAASTFTTRDRAVPVELTVPDAYDAQAVQVLVPVLIDRLRAR